MPSAASVELHQAGDLRGCCGERSQGTIPMAGDLVARPTEKRESFSFRKGRSMATYDSEANIKVSGSAMTKIIHWE